MLDEVGMQLRARRESLGLSLEDIQKETKIRIKYLRALEEGDESSLPVAVYTRGIVRRYCEVVGLDGAAMARKLGEWWQERDEASLTERLVRMPGSSHITLRPARPGRSWGVLIVVFALVVVTGLAAAAYYLIILPQAELPPGEEPPITDDPADVEPPGEDPDPDPAADPTEPPDPKVVVVSRHEGPGAQDVTYVVEGADEIIVILEATARCWIRVLTDGDFVVETTMAVGETRQWEAEQEMVIRTGNTPGLLLIVNGEDMGVPSDRGPRNLRFRFPE